MRQGTVRCAATALGALLLAAPAPAQYREYYVQGRVVDTQKAPIAGVEVRVLDASTSRSYRARTDAKGVFKLAGLPHAVYAVTFTRDGYTSFQDEWKLEAAQSTMKKVDQPDVVLAPVAPVQQGQSPKETDSEVKEAAERIRQGDPDGAIALMKGLLEKKPEEVNALFLLGVGYARKQMYREALDPLTKVTEANPDLARAWFELGSCHRKLGDAAKALEAYEKNLQLDPANADGMYNCGLILFETGRIDEALARFQQGLALKPADPDLLDMAGRCYVHQQKWDRAVELLEKARAATSDPAKAAFLDELVRKIKAGTK